MGAIINHNGSIKPAETLLFNGSNRAFRYGDGLFETIRAFNGQLPFLKYHIERLLKGLDILKFELPDHYNTEFFNQEIQALVKNKGNHRIRLNVFRSDGGLYTPENNLPEFLIETNPLNGSIFKLNKKGLKIGVFDEVKLNFDSFSALKTNSKLPYVLAGIYCKEQKLDDCLILNFQGRTAESLSSNLFLVEGNRISTPALSEACISGTMRKMMLQIGKAKGFEIKEIKLSLSRIKAADELWLTNAIQGIRWVNYFEDSIFGNQLAGQFIKYLNDKIEG